MLHRDRAVPVALGLAAAALTFAFYAQPTGVAGWIAGEAVSVVEAEGGYRVPVRAPHATPAEIALLENNLWQRAALRSEHVRTSIDGEIVHVDLARVSRREAEEFALLQEDGVALRMQIVVENTEVMQDLYRVVSEEAPPDVWAHLDQWTDDSGQIFTDPYLWADTRDALHSYLHGQTEPELQLPANLEYGFERVVTLDPETNEATEYWRSYVLDREQTFLPIITGARVVANAYTGIPSVVVDYDEASGREFGRLTGENVGRKLAILFGGTISSAPVIQSAITAGSTEITMGGTEPDPAGAEAHRLVDALRNAPLPITATAGAVTKLEASAASAVLIARLLWALAVGVLAFFAARLLGPRVRVAEVRGPGERGPSTLPWRQGLVTLGGVALLLVGAQVMVPGLDKGAIEAITGSPGVGWGQGLDVFVIGLVPFISAWVLVELGCLVLTSTRELRLSGPAGRAKIDRVVLVLGTGLALVQAIFITVWMESVGRGLGYAELVLVPEPGWGFRAVATLTLTAGSLFLLAVARWISRAGLGNGIAVLLLVGSCVELVRVFSPPSVPPGAYAASAAGASWEQLVVYLVVAAASCGLLLLRVSTPGGRRGLRVPTSGAIPLAWASSLMMLASLAWQMGVDVPSFLFEIAAPTENLAQEIAVVVVLTVALSLLFCRGAGAMRDQIAAATVVSALFLVALVVAPRVLHAHGLPLAYPLLEVVLLTAIVMDLVAEVRARLRRDDWVAVWPMQRVQLVDPAVDRLRAEGIDVFVRGVYFRSLLQFFGPFVSATLFVREADRERAFEIAAQVAQRREEMPLARAVASGE